jgi:hypothetical protein
MNKRAELINEIKIKYSEHARQYNSYREELEELGKIKDDEISHNCINSIKDGKGLYIKEGDNFIDTNQFKDTISLDEDGKFKLSFRTLEKVLTSYDIFSNEFNKKEPINEYLNINATSKLMIKFKLTIKMLDINQLSKLIKEDICRILKEEYKVIVDFNKIDVLKQNDIYIISISDHNIMTKINNIYHFAKKMLENDNYNKFIEIIDPIIKDNKYINNIDVETLRSLSNPDESIVNLILKSMYSPETLEILNKNIVFNFHINIGTLIDTNVNNSPNTNIISGNENSINTNTKRSNKNKKVCKDFIKSIKDNKEYQKENLSENKLFEDYKKYMLDKYSKLISNKSKGPLMREMRQLGLLKLEDNEIHKNITLIK